MYSTEGEQEKLFHDNKDLFRATWEEAPDAMAVSLPDGTVISANSAYYRLYSKTPTEVLGHNYAIIFPVEERSWAQRLYAQVFESPVISPSFEHSMRRTDGTELFVESRYTFLMSEGKRVAMISIVRDITAQKKSEEALFESECRLSLALEAAELGTWEWDIVSNRVHWSEDQEAGFGPVSPPAEITYEQLLERVHPADRSLVQREVRQALEEAESCAMDYRIIWPDGTVRWIRSLAQALYDEDGKPQRFIAVNRDITRDKQAAESL
jgi:PAS domain S-box-containing protein